MKKRITSIMLAFLILFPMLTFPVNAVTDPNNGDWTAKTITLNNTQEAELMARTGDIDNLGFGFEEGYNPFSAQETSPHSYPWEPNSEDPSGTDRIMLGSSYNGTNPMDGYSDSYKESDPSATREQPITLTYDASGIKVKSALLQLYVDDFQAPVFGSKFTVTLNGKDAPYVAEIINHISQTGPLHT